MATADELFGAEIALDAWRSRVKPLWGGVRREREAVFRLQVSIGMTGGRCLAVAPGAAGDWKWGGWEYLTRW